MNARAAAPFEELVEAAVERAVERKLTRLEEILSSLVTRLPARLLTVDEAARELGLHPETVRKMCRNGALSHRRVGRALRIDIDASRPLVQR